MNSDVPQITVVIPTYNRIEFLKEAIRSCYRSGNGLNLEIVIVDDASTENIASLLLGEGDVKYIRLDKNSGAAYARNIGKCAATGDYVKFLDSDDVLNDGVLIIEYAEARRTRADIVVSGWQEVYLNEQYIERPGEIHTAPVFANIIDDLLLGKSVPTSSALYSRNAIMSVEWNPELIKLNDWDYFIKAALVATRIVSLDQVAYRWRHHSQVRLTSSASFLTNSKAFYRILGDLEISLRANKELTIIRSKRLAQYLYKELRGVYRFEPRLGREMLSKIEELDPQFIPIDEERSYIFRWLCKYFPIHLVLSLYGFARRAIDRLG